MRRLLAAYVLICLSGGAAQAEVAPPLTGQDIAAVVRAALAANGQDAVPMLADQRRFFSL